ncbi:hypothetical protein ED236_08605 [Pseudomethylobacillus aquaticus]|uniref:DUF904 domain-containing protein n=1 Tax=Pseudomethylobacillus aquaticus TaxID=2676064 RepID=A0A3N0UZW1_9PROT|nr:hypothetical protein [Pseudomethylobacillus aquaticus]ROH85791.1 hypothetical protein ED236_08605 [Pseudomethylobacillus aquaticus]
MDKELQALELKLDELIAVNASLRRDNARLRQSLVEAQVQKDQLATQMQAAGSKLKSLLERLPEAVS